MRNGIKRLLRSKIFSRPLVKLLLLSAIIFLSSFGGFSLFYNFKEITHFAVYCIGGYGYRIKLLNEENDNCREQYKHLNEKYCDAKRKPDSLQRQLTELERLIDKNKIKFNKIIILGIHGFKKELIAHTEWDRLTTIRRNNHKLLKIEVFDFVDIDTIHAMPEWYCSLLEKREPWFRVQMLNAIFRITRQEGLPSGTCNPAPSITKIWNSVYGLTIVGVQDTITCTHKPVYVRPEYWFSGKSNDNTWLCRAIPDMEYLKSIGKDRGYIEAILDSTVIENSY
jgi:hypothetical protein